MNKQQLRKQLLEMRRNLDPTWCKQQSKIIIAKCLALPEYQQANKVSCYLSTGNEVATWELIEHILAAGKQLFVPKFVSKGTINLVKYTGGDALVENQYGIMEPEPEVDVDVDIASSNSLDDLGGLDVIFLPVVGFDKLGNRIGMGSGCYDRLLAKLGEHTKCFGLAFDFQQVAGNIDVDEWDVPVGVIS